MPSGSPAWFAAFYWHHKNFVFLLLSSVTNRIISHSPELDRRCVAASAAILLRRRRQGCQMAYFQTKNPNLGKFWSTLQ
jgi:hypothetical protein